MTLGIRSCLTPPIMPPHVRLPRHHGDPLTAKSLLRRCARTFRLLTPDDKFRLYAENHRRLVRFQVLTSPLQRNGGHGVLHRAPGALWLRDGCLQLEIPFCGRSASSMSMRWGLCFRPSDCNSMVRRSCSTNLARRRTSTAPGRRAASGRGSRRQPRRCGIDCA